MGAMLARWGVPIMPVSGKGPPVSGGLTVASGIAASGLVVVLSPQAARARPLAIVNANRLLVSRLVRTCMVSALLFIKQMAVIKTRPPKNGGRSAPGQQTARLAGALSSV